MRSPSSWPTHRPPDRRRPPARDRSGSIPRSPKKARSRLAQGDAAIGARSGELEAPSGLGGMPSTVSAASNTICPPGARRRVVAGGVSLRGGPASVRRRGTGTAATPDGKPDKNAEWLEDISTKSAGRRGAGKRVQRGSVRRSLIERVGIAAEARDRASGLATVCAGAWRFRRPLCRCWSWLRPSARSYIPTIMGKCVLRLLRVQRGRIEHASARRCHRKNIPRTCTAGVAHGPSRLGPSTIRSV